MSLTECAHAYDHMSISPVASKFARNVSARLISPVLAVHVRSDVAPAVNKRCLNVFASSMLCV